MKEEVGTLQDFTMFQNNIIMAFVHLVTIVTVHLEKVKFSTIRRACMLQIKTPTGAKLSRDFVEKIASTKNLDELLDILTVSPYLSWIDLRLLEALAAASGSAIAKRILSNYKEVIFSYKLREVLPITPSKQISDEFYDKIVSKLDQDADKITVADLLKFQSKLERVIMDISEGTCVLEHIEDGCIKIHWFIPAHIAQHAFKSASCNHHKFHEMHLQYLQIETFPTIFDPLATKLSEPYLSQLQPPAITGKVELIDSILNFRCTSFPTLCHVIF